VRIEAFYTVPDSGGAGLHRGGNGINIVYRFLENGEISIHDDRWLTSPWGVNGGLPGTYGPLSPLSVSHSRPPLACQCTHGPPFTSAAGL
jgi:N-methylhydantoinase B